MTKEIDNKNNAYTMEKAGQVGEIMIADDVIATIVGLAATEVEGVASMQGNLNKEIVGKLGVRNLTKGVRVEVVEGIVTAHLSLTMNYGYSIPKTSAAVQERVKSAVENMLGLQVAEVNIRIVGMDMNTAK